MNNFVKKILAVALLVGIAQTLSGCVVYDERRPYYYDHDHWRHW